MMMQGIRKAGQTWLGKIVVGILFSILILSFAIWGIGDIFRGGGRNTVVTVGKTEIGLEQVRAAYQTEIQQLSRRFRQNITNEQARAIGIDQQVLSRLVTEAVLDTVASERGLAVGDDAVRQSIIDDPGLRDSQGQFNRAAFNEYLRQVGLTEAQFVREQRARILRLQLGEAVSGATAAPLVMQEAAHRYRNEQRVIDFIELLPGKVGEPAVPTEEQLRAFYEQRRASFRAPEYRTARAIVLTPQTLADPAAISDGDAAQHYERIKGRFGTAERRTIQQIVFPTQAEANAALERLRGGLSFEDLARERGISDADLTLGSFSRSELLDQNVGNAVFGLALNEVGAPVQGAFGYVLPRVTLIEPERVRPLAEVAAEVRGDLAAMRARSQLADVHDRIEDMRASARPLAEIAAEKKLPLLTIGPIDRQRQPAPGVAIPDVPQLQQVVEGMFRADIGTDNEAIRTTDGGYVWYDVTGIEPARERNFDEVRAQVAALWREDEVATRLETKAREFVARIGRGEKLETIARELGLEAQVSPALTRQTNAPEFPANVLTLAFGTPVNGAASASLPAGRGRMLFQVRSASVPPFLRTTQEAEQFAQQLGVGIGDDLLAQFVTATQNQLGVRINQQNFRNATGGES